MGLRESFDELDSGAKVLVVIAVGFFGLIAAIAALVIFAAVLGTFVLSLGGTVDATAPQASFSIQESGAGTEIVLVSGEPLAADRLVVAVNDEARSWAARDADTAPGDTIRAGDSVTLSGLSSGDVVQVRWPGAEGEPTTIYASYEVP